MLDLVMQLLGLTQAVLGHFFTGGVTVSSDVSGEWFVNMNPVLSAKGHAVTGALSSIIDYGTVILAQLLAVLALGATTAGGYAGNGNLIPQF